MTLTKSLGNFSVGVAAYPDKHPRSADLASDTAFLVQKIRAGADYAITQMLFSAEDYLALRDRMTAAGVDVPVLPGIMPITSYARLMRIHELSGQRIPADLAEELRSVQDDPAAGRAVGMDHAVRDERAAAGRGRAVPALLYLQPVEGDHRGSHRTGYGTGASPVMLQFVVTRSVPAVLTTVIPVPLHRNEGLVMIERHRPNDH